VGKREKERVTEKNREEIELERERMKKKESGRSGRLYYCI